MKAYVCCCVWLSNKTSETTLFLYLFLGKSIFLRNYFFWKVLVVFKDKYWKRKIFNSQLLFKMHYIQMQCTGVPLQQYKISFPVQTLLYKYLDRYVYFSVCLRTVCNVSFLKVQIIHFSFIHFLKLHFHQISYTLPFISHSFFPFLLFLSSPLATF